MFKDKEENPFVKQLIHSKYTKAIRGANEKAKANVITAIGEIERYNIFRARMLVRCDANGKLFLYDIVQIKKKRARRLSKNCTVENFASLKVWYYIIFRMSTQK